MLNQTRAGSGRNVLTQLTIRNAEPGPKLYRLSDGDGLHLAILPTGVKSWRLRFTFKGVPGTVGLGEFPAVTCQMARAKAAEARRTLALGINPVEQRRESRRVHQAPQFEKIAREWHRQMATAKKWCQRHADNVISSLERDVFPKLGKRDPAGITSKDILELVVPVAERARQTAERVQQRVRAILDHAAVLGLLTTGNPATVRLDGILPKIEQGHFEPVPLPAMPALVQVLQAGQCRVDLNVRLALRFVIFTVGRSQEIRKAAWNQIDYENRVWCVPVEHMKTRIGEHLVPLTAEALAVLEEARAMYTGGELIFPSIMKPGQPLSDVTLSNALHKLTPLGVPHGIRTTFSTWAHEQPELRSRTIEMCLSHIDKDKTRAAYDASVRLEERRDILTRWARVARGLPN